MCKQGFNKTNKRGRPSSDLDNNLRKKCQKSLASYIPPIGVRKDGIGHFPILVENIQHCKNYKCGKLTSVKCDKCGVLLCFNKNNNCFKSFHI